MRSIARLMFLVLGVACAALLVAALSTAPGLPPAPAPDGADVTRARETLHRLRHLSDGAGEGALRLERETIEAGLRMGGRVIEGARLDAALDPAALRLAGSLPLAGTGLWLNLRLTVPPFEGTPRGVRLGVGAIDLPPGASLAVLEGAARLALGARDGARAIEAVRGLSLDGESVTLTLRLDGTDRGRIAGRTLAALRGGTLPDPDRVAADYVAIRDAIDDGRLPREGSLAPHLRFALDRAAADRADPAGAWTSAILALAKACGAADMALVSGRMIGAAAGAGRWRHGCDAVTLRGRTDTRRHFVTAAAIQAASSRGVSMPMGEFKELFDSVARGNGFDFTDVAANAAGIRLSQAAIAAGPGLAALRDRIAGEDDVMISLDGLPGRLPEADFIARFGSVEDPRYAEQLAEIEARIDTLRLHGGTAPHGLASQ